MWFLGDPPKNIKIALNSNNPGPVEIDFDALESKDQKAVLMGLRYHFIEASEPFEVLYRKYAEAKPVEPQAPPPPVVKQYLEAKKAVRDQDKLLKEQAKILKKEKDLDEKAIYFSKKSVRAIKSEIIACEDKHFLNKLRRAEMENKGRKAILDQIELQLKKIHYLQSKEVKASLEKADSLPPLKNIIPNETIEFEVSESDAARVAVNLDEIAGGA